MLGEVCRKCHINKDNLVNINGIPSFPEWTEEEYDEICDRLEIGEEEVPRRLRERCLFNRLESFHAVRQMPFDCMHDWYERVAQYDGRSIIMAFVKSKSFSLQAYNNALKLVKLSASESGAKPIPIKGKGDKLVGKAMSIAVHVRVMPVVISMITDLETDDPELVKLLVLLHKLNEFMLMETAAPSDVYTLQELLSDYLLSRKKCSEKYGKKFFHNVTAKYHFLEHYAEQLLLFGPFKYVMTARPESKHRDFVNYLESSKNYINVPLTLSVKNQKRLAARCYRGMFTDIVYKFPTKVSPLSEGVGNFDPNLFLRTDLLSDKVTVHNTLYKTGDIVVLNAESPHKLVIGDILKVVIRGSKVFFLVEIHQSRLNKLNIFETCPLRRVEIVPYSSCVDYKPLVKREEGQNFTFVLHHRFPGRHIPHLD